MYNNTRRSSPSRQISTSGAMQADDMECVNLSRVYEHTRPLSCAVLFDWSGTSACPYSLTSTLQPKQALPNAVALSPDTLTPYHPTPPHPLLQRHNPNGVELYMGVQTTAKPNTGIHKSSRTSDIREQADQNGCTRAVRREPREAYGGMLEDLSLQETLNVTGTREVTAFWTFHVRGGDFRSQRHSP